MTALKSTRFDQLTNFQGGREVSRNDRQMINYTIDELMSRLGCKKFPERWREIYEEAKNILTEGTNPLLSPEYYGSLHEKYGVFENTLEYYQKAAAMIAEKEELSLFLCLLCRALRDRATIQRDIAQMEIPSALEGEDVLPYDMMTALSLCQSYDAFYEQMRRHNVPDDILVESLRIPERCVEINARRSGRPRLTNFDWYQLAYDGKLYRVGRLQLEFPLKMPGMYKVFENKNGELTALANQKLHRDGFALGSRGYEDEEGSFTATIEETDDSYVGYPFDFYGHVNPEKITLKKTDWAIKLSGGDLLVGLHIPPDEPFGHDVVEEAITLSRELLKNCYPEYEYKAFFCASWLLDHAIIDLLGKDANTSKFSARFLTFGVKSAGVSTFSFVFRTYGDVKIEELPENSRLQRILKKHYLDGKAIYEMHGVFF